MGEEEGRLFTHKYQQTFAHVVIEETAYPSCTCNIEHSNCVKCQMFNNGKHDLQKNQTKVETLWENISEDTKVEGNRKTDLTFFLNCCRIKEGGSSDILWFYLLAI